jgi:hypothetical protein
MAANNGGWLSNHDKVTSMLDLKTNHPLIIVAEFGGAVFGKRMFSMTSVTNLEY